MTKNPNRGGRSLPAQWRVGLCAAATLLMLHAPVAQADAFGGNAAKASKELNDRLEQLEKRLAEVSERAAAPALVPEGLNLPAPPSPPPVPEDELKLDYEVKGELNGASLVKVNNRLQLMTRAELERFEAKAKARARLNLTKAAEAGATPSAPGAPPGGGVLNLPPVPPAPAGAKPPVPVAAKPAPGGPAVAGAPAPAAKTKAPPVAAKPGPMPKAPVTPTK